MNEYKVTVSEGNYSHQRIVRANNVYQAVAEVRREQREYRFPIGEKRPTERDQRRDFMLSGIRIGGERN